MRLSPPTSATLRAEARLLAAAGAILLALGFPLTITLAIMALQPDGLAPIVPIAIGAPPLALGYVACHLASQRMQRARRLEQVASWQPPASSAS